MISLLVTTLLLGIVSIIFFYNAYSIQLTKKKELDLACFSAIQLFMTDNNEYLVNERFMLIDSIKVKLVPKMDGLYLKVNTTAYNKFDSSSVNYYLAAKPEVPFDNAIIISKPNLRASVSGETTIVGNILGTSDKIKRGRISGKPTASNNYIVGNLIKKEDITIKFFNENFVNALFENNNLFDNSNYLDSDFELNQLTLKQLSHDKINIINGDFVLSGIIEKHGSQNQISLVVMGETIIKEGTISELDLNIMCDSLTIEENVKIENIIIAVNTGIEINGNSYLKNIQLFSKKSILINNCILEYPSTIVLYSKTEEVSNLNNSIEINSSIVNGSIILVNSNVGLSNNKNIITIDNSSKIQGLIYSENNVNISGQVSGVIYTNNFWYYKEPTEYINWLVDLKINRVKLDSTFLLPIGFEDNNRLSILNEKWIN